MSTHNIQFHDKIRKFSEIFVFWSVEEFCRDSSLEEFCRDSEMSSNKPW